MFQSDFGLASFALLQKSRAVIQRPPEPVHRRFQVAVALQGALRFVQQLSWLVYGRRIGSSTLLEHYELMASIKKYLVVHLDHKQGLRACRESNHEKAFPVQKFRS